MPGGSGQDTSPDARSWAGLGSKGMSAAGHCPALSKVSAPCEVCPAEEGVVERSDVRKKQS
jgi:hypothetical protein